MEEKRVLLDVKDFEKLISGEILEKDGVKIALSDIGYHKMIEIISKYLNWK
jgi:predicted GTPase